MSGLVREMILISAASRLALGVSFCEHVASMRKCYQRARGGGQVLEPKQKGKMIHEKIIIKEKTQ